MALTDLDDDFAAMRSALDLTLAEQIVVWSLRRYKAADGRLEALAPTYRQVFGLAGVERALASFGGMIAAIEGHSRRRGAPAGLDRLHLSPTESCVLRLVTATQTGDDGTADAVAAWLVTHAGHAALVGSAQHFSACLAVAGQQLASDDTARLFAVAARNRGRHVRGRPHARRNPTPAGHPHLGVSRQGEPLRRPRADGAPGRSRRRQRRGQPSRHALQFVGGRHSAYRRALPALPQPLAGRGAPAARGRLRATPLGKRRGVAGAVAAVRCRPPDH
jgi:hypothetical protein